jgi:hypothetical protein
MNLPARLTDLAKQINQEHHQCETAARSAVEHAINAGNLLIEAKAQCPHGRWGTWISENFEGSIRTAQAYMRIAREWPELAEANTQTSAHLSIDGALKALAEPKESDPEPEPEPMDTNQTRASLEKLETRIESWLIDLRTAVPAILYYETYRERGYESFDAFCRNEWDLSADLVHDLVRGDGDAFVQLTEWAATRRGERR